MSTCDLEMLAAAALRHISRNEAIKAYVQQNTALYNVLLRAALRIIGGETLFSRARLLPHLLAHHSPASNT
jgi:hypothetical protein